MVPASQFPSVNSDMPSQAAASRWNTPNSTRLRRSMEGRSSPQSWTRSGFLPVRRTGAGNDKNATRPCTYAETTGCNPKVSNAPLGEVDIIPQCDRSIDAAIRTHAQPKKEVVLLWLPVWSCNMGRGFRA